MHFPNYKFEEGEIYGNKQEVEESQQTKVTKTGKGEGRRE